VPRLVLHDVGVEGAGQRIAGVVPLQAEGGQRQPLDEHLHAQVGHVPAAVADHVLEQGLQAGVDGIGEPELLVEEATVGLHVARLVDDLGGRVELAVDVGNCLDDLAGADQRALLAVHELGVAPGCVVTPHVDPVTLAETLPDG